MHHQYCLKTGLWLAAGLALVLSAPTFAQAPKVDSATASFSAAPLVLDKLPRGGRVAVVLRGAVKDGWHVYALKQPENGPTPLVVSLEANVFAQPAGAPQGSAPLVAHDGSFNLDLPFYARTFTVTVPVRLNGRRAAGRFALPVSVRFQTCNGQVCQPPKTLHLLVPVEVGAAG